MARLGIDSGWCRQKLESRYGYGRPGILWNDRTRRTWKYTTRSWIVRDAAIKPVGLSWHYGVPESASERCRELRRTVVTSHHSGISIRIKKWRILRTV